MLARFYRRLLARPVRPAERGVAVREAAEALDDIEMLPRIFVEHRVGEPAEQAQRFALVGDILAMLIGEIGELPPFAKASALPRSILRGTWSNRIVAASAVSGSVRKCSAGSDRSAARQSPASARTAASKSPPPPYQSSMPWASNQKASSCAAQSAGGAAITGWSSSVTRAYFAAVSTLR